MTGSLLLDRIRAEGKFPVASNAGSALLRLRRAGETNVGTVAKAIEGDAKLQALVFRLARPGEEDADDTEDKLLWILADEGPGPVRLAALALSTLTSNPVGSCEEFDYDGFWSRGLARGIAAREFSLALGVGHPLEAFALGLLAEIGALMLAGAFPEQYAELLTGSDELTRDEVTELEREAFGADRDSLTLAMLEYLGFPGVLVACLEEVAASELRGLTPPQSSMGIVDILVVAERTAELVLADPSRQAESWFELVQFRHRLNQDRETFYATGDQVAAEWWAWGDLLRVPTRHVPSFADLAQDILDSQGAGGSLKSLDTLARGAAANRQDNDADVSLRVLVVDDDPVSRRLLQKHLTNAGHTVVTAEDGRQGLALAMEDMPNLIVADWVMPEMDGVDLCRALRRFDAGRKIFFMLVTGREEEARLIEAFDAGVDDFVTKPVQPRSLMARVRAAIRFIGLQHELEEEKRRLHEELNRKKHLAGKLRMAALTDVLTELPNRRYAIKRLSEEWACADRSGAPLSLIMLDIDDFKVINDTYGHDVGDEVLREIGRVLERHTRVGESACRLGGEEFVVICADSELDDAVLCGERIRKAVERKHIVFGEFSGSITVSVGVSERRSNTRDLDHLLKLADQAVYRAKALGRNRTVSSSGENDGFQEAV
jgi:two-component system cell cycle response regulator